jgi:hypothetical protein
VPVVLYGCKTGSLILKGRHRLRESSDVNVLTDEGGSDTRMGKTTERYETLKKSCHVLPWKLTTGLPYNYG